MIISKRVLRNHGKVRSLPLIEYSINIHTVPGTIRVRNRFFSIVAKCAPPHFIPAIQIKYISTHKHEKWHMKCIDDDRNGLVRSIKFQQYMSHDH